MELKGPYEPGKWTYSIEVTTRDVFKTVFVVVHQNVKDGILVQSFLDTLASTQGINASKTYAVTTFANAGDGLSEGHEVRCDLWRPNINDPDDMLLHDEGLTSNYQQFTTSAARCGNFGE
jgi:hypothetical protein